MTTIDAARPLADLVTERPDRALVLDRFGLDFCCGGQRSLASAVEAKGLALDDVVAALDAAVAPADVAWAELGLADLADHVVAVHHAYLDRALPQLNALADKVATVHGERHPELAEVRRLVVELRADLEPHMRKEEQVLFPMIRELVGGAPSRLPGASLAGPISVMESEHDTVGELLATLRSITGEYQVPADGCASYQALYAGLAEAEADTHLHVHKENNVLFPGVLAAEAALATTV